MKIPRHKLENNTINSVFDSGSNNIITKKICPKGPKLCSAKCMASLHCLSPSRRREAPCEGTNSPRLFTPGETKALAMTSQTAPDWQLQIGESGASSRYNFNLELERLACKQTALAA